ncbi:MAG TPA: hypothetical protein VGL19_06470 [Polyangiaceae bacterium]|jgi:hypothetical protein
MANAAGLTRSALSLGCILGLSNCDPPGSSAPAPPAPKHGAASSTQTPSPPATPTPRHEPSDDSLTVSEIPDEQPASPAASASGPKPVAKLIIDEPQEVGPAGQMTADEHGVVMIDRTSQVLSAKRAALSTSPERASAHFSQIHGSPNDFFAVARGPLLLRGKAYWVSDGKLVRRTMDNSGKVEVLANDARNGTRVVGADVPGAPAHAVYITNPLKEDAPPRARLWVEGTESLTLSPEGAGASSIAVAGVGEDLFAVAIDARSAMTPMHGRRISFKAGKPELGPDVVMWVGASSQTLSEVFAASTPLGVRAFLPIERDTSHFGLIMLELGSEPHMDPKTVWRGYPNGIDVAPVASGALCGTAFVAYVRPETQSPDSHELLELAEITASGLGPAEVVDHASGFSNVSLGAATNSAVLAYVADFRTYATTLRCTHKK